MSSPPNGLDVPRDQERAVSTASTLHEEEIPSVLDEKVGQETDNGSDKASEKASKQDQELGIAGDEPEQEYPSGFKMFFIVLALVLSVFLLSLDMVRPLPWESLYDDRSDLQRPSLLQLFPKSPTSLRASTRWDGTVQLSS